MPGAGDRSTTFERPTTNFVTDLAAASLGAIAVVGHWGIAFAIFSGALISTSRSRTASATSELRRLFERLAVACVVAALYAPPLARWATGAAVAGLACMVLRRVHDAVNRRPNRAWQRGLATVLVGNEDDVRRAAQLFASHPEHLVRPVATATVGGVPTVLPNAPVTNLRQLVADHGAEHVLVVTPGFGDHIVATYGKSRPHGVRLSVMAPMAEILTPGVDVINVRGLPCVSLAARRPPTGGAWAVKRVIDFVMAALLLVLVLPVFAMTALATLIDSGRPIFFRQKRVGRDGKLFDLWKFRSMVVDAEERLVDLRDANEASGPYFKMQDDPRVTRVGRLLRRLSIDELPQLFNVLRGEMSLVGPRPFLPGEMEADPELFDWRLPFTPGITGLWQVAGRSWLPVAEGVRMDLTYVENWSLGVDFRIMLRTVSAALRGDRRPSVVGAETMPALTRARYLGLVDGDDLLKSATTWDLSVVIVTHESKADIATCLESLRRLPDEVTREIILVDNASKDGTAELVATRYPEVRLIRKRHRDGFATNVNIGAVAASGRHLLVLNPDTSVFSGTLDRLVEHLDTHPQVGVVGPRLVYPNGEHQASARRFPTPVNTIVRRTPLRKLVGTTRGSSRHLMADSRLSEVMEVDWLLGAVLAVRAEALHEVGGLDDHFRLYCEDIDLCWRMHKAGWRVEYLPTATVQHALGELTAKRFFTVRTIWHFRSMARFVRLHGLRLEPRPLLAGPRPVRRVELIDGTPLTALSDSAA
ncbi:MAG: hypothetical protein QOI95_3542 [Acidimicrobiaceae bacterium]|jgi:exopolysaccharide biosynthesis polyprenyl glycosylphosphotransferase